MDRSAETAEDEVRRLNDEYIRAFIDSDAEWYETHLADDFRCISSNGELIQRDEFIRRARKPLSLSAFELDQVEVQVDGGLAIVQATTRYRRHDVSVQNRYIDIWVRRGASWKTLTAQITPVLAP